MVMVTKKAPMGPAVQAHHGSPATIFPSGQGRRKARQSRPRAAVPVRNEKNEARYGLFM
jgi:hypothetical protein